MFSFQGKPAALADQLADHAAPPVPDKSCVNSAICFCGNEKAKSKRYCKQHQKAYDNTRTDVMKNYDEKNPTKEQEEFIKVFGSRKDAGLPDVANKVVAE